MGELELIENIISPEQMLLEIADIIYSNIDELLGT